MKNIFYSLITLLCSVSLQTYAQIDGTGYDHGNGGDPCEMRFGVVAMDLLNWITYGGAKSLTFPPEISYDSYRQEMSQKIQAAKVSCVDEKVFVEGAEKTCINFTDASGIARIQCNRDRFMSTSENDQYVLVHHEYAGLSGFEKNNGETSNYTISNQITTYLEDLIVKKVVVKPPPDFTDPFDPASCTDPNMTSEEVFKSFSTYMGAAVATFRIYTRERWCNNPNGCEAWKTIPNQITYTDATTPRKYMTIPEGGVINYLMPSYMSSMVIMSTTQAAGMGLYLNCTPGDKEADCTVMSTPYMQNIGEAKGMIGAHCARLTFRHEGFFADKAFFESEYIFKYQDNLIPNPPWIERESVILSRY